MTVICLHVYAYQHAILQYLDSDLCRYICRYGLYRQIKYLSADIRHICRYADMEKFSRYLSADISAGISADSIGRLDYRSYSNAAQLLCNICPICGCPGTIEQTLEKPNPSQHILVADHYAHPVQAIRRD